jgi:uncharacterized linocin/CFP29 family protein
MEYNVSPVQWTDEQWNLVQETVRNEARKVRVAASFLPLYGPLPPDAESVPLQAVDEEDTAEPNEAIELLRQIASGSAAGKTNLRALLQSVSQGLGTPQYSARRQRGEAQKRLRVDDRKTRPLTTISVNVHLGRAQIAQPDLSDALIMFRRAANIIARVEDRLVFGGQPHEDPGPDELGVQPPIFRVTGGESFPGLVQSAKDSKNTVPTAAPGQATSGNSLVKTVVNGITILEGFGHLAPFALALGSDLFVTANDPHTNSLVLPADRIKPLLDGPILRTSTIAPGEGVLVSLASDLVDLVVASDICVQFLQATMEPRYVYRVSECFTLRIKQPQAIVALVSPPTRGGGGRGGRKSRQRAANTEESG